MMKICLFSLAFLWAFSANAQQLPQQRSIPENAEQFPEYQVGPGDILSIQVFGLSQFDQATRISNSGKIHVRYLGVLPVANMTVAGIENEIAKQLRDRQLVKEPWVRVQVSEYNAQPVFVVGEVTIPGQYVMGGEMHLLDAITKAGGLTSTAGDEAILIRRRNGSTFEMDTDRQVPENPSISPSQPRSPQPTVNADTATDNKRIKINIAELIDGTHPELNVQLQGGDVFYVPKMSQRVIYVIGEVGLPGAYILPRSYKHLTAAAVLSYAGGPTPKSAKMNEAYVVRRNQNGDIQRIQFSFAKSLRGEEPDTPIKPGDILFVPRSTGKAIGYKFFDLFADTTFQWMIF
jgi:polysaccharide biosynthesis/export protein